MKPFKLLAMALSAILLAPLLVGVSIAVEEPAPAQAAVAADFNPGMIITDSLFYDGSAMSAAAVQSFLEARVPVCRGPLPCMKTALATTPNMPAEAGLCNAYQGVVNESLSSVIAKVGYACGISQKVLLVLLQKEQSLVSATSPTQGQYNSATGFSCPDTAPCDPAYTGFFYQVYYAARQFKYYALKPNSFNHQAGRVNYVRYHPDAGCGTSGVYIQNLATAGLYNYTPYQPNWAALDNMYGEGSYCSSYGNRNFWRMYTDWFGSTSAGAGFGSLVALYNSPGVATRLGADLETFSCPMTATSCSQNFANGSIYWSATYGAWPVYGLARDYYVAQGAMTGSLGPPTAAELVVAGGTSQPFRWGNIYSVAAATAAVYGAIQTEFARLGGPGGVLGWPLAKDVCGLPAGGCAQQFQNGGLYYTAAATRAVLGALNTQFVSAGGPAGSLGYPAAAHVTVSAAGGGLSQQFQNAVMYSSPAGTAAVYGGIQTEFARLGGPGGPLGWPTAGDVCGLPGGGCSQQFQNGGLYYTAAATRAVLTAINSVYTTAGGPAGALGYPSAAATAVTAAGGGTVQQFQNATVYSSSAGAFAVSGLIRNKYVAVGEVSGSMGWPIAAEVCGSGGCSQQFQNGSLNQGAIQAFYASLGGPSGSLGASTGSEVTVAGGSYQPFRWGTIYSSAIATVAVYGDIRAEFARQGGPGGTLGWPTAGDVCGLTGGGCSQQFQNGGIYYTATATRSVLGAINAAYVAASGPAGAYGYPTASTVTDAAAGGGTSQQFQNATVYSSSAGAFAVVGAIRTQYQSGGGPGGTLGWPTAAEVCATTGCSQQFQNGSITQGAIAAFYATLGGAGGSLGAATGSEVSAAGGVSQSFRWGTIYSSAAGTVAVYGGIRTEFVRMGGPEGSLGWPTAGDVCGLAGGGCSQQFQNGGIYYTAAATRSVPGAINTLYATAGGPGGSMGYPQGASVSISQAGGGSSQQFQFATVYMSAAGTAAVYGAIQTEFARQSGPAGALGWPIAGDVCGLPGGGCSQQFQTGGIYYSPAGTRSSFGAVNSLFVAQGGPAGTFGYPLGAPTTIAVAGGGSSQQFQNVAVYSSAAGAFAVAGQIRAQYVAGGEAAGSLGWPVAAEACTSSGCTQQFQNGTLTSTP